MSTLPNRHAISRARFFLDLADQCKASERDAHEAYMEAAIIFCRTAIHRLKTRYHRCDGWKSWFDSLRSNASVNFIQNERNFIVKEAQPKVGQVIRLGQTVEKAKDFYYYESPDISAIETVRRHVNEVERIIYEGESKFGDGKHIPA
jgi:hypothetical protein